MRNLLEIDDLSSLELLEVLDRSEQSDLSAVLAGQGAMLLFEKPSSRTRTSMEMAVVQLGGHPVTLRSEEIGIDTRESAEDLGRLFSGYGSIIGARVFEHHKLQRLAATSLLSTCCRTRPTQCRPLPTCSPFDKLSVALTT